MAQLLTETTIGSSAVKTSAALSAVSAAAAPSSGYPDATNTGVKAGVALTKYSGTLHITQDNAVISNMEVLGDIIIDAKNVTLSNIKLISNTEWHVLRIMDDASGFTLKDSEIDGRGLSDNGVYGHGTILRTNIHDVENGMTLWGPSVVSDNYIHDLRNNKADPHYDGIQINGGENIKLTHNTIINDYDQTAALMLENTFGGLANITVDNNRLVGGGYTVYLDGRKGGGTVDDDSIHITNNQIGGGHWGDFSLYDDHPVLSGNTGLTGTPAPAPTPTPTPVPVPTPSATVYNGTAGDDTMPVAGKTSAGNETYNGLGGNDVLKGGAGADMLNGGDGYDTANYSGSAAVKVNLLTGLASGGQAAGDKLVAIEKLVGSGYADVFQGNAANNILEGGAGADRLEGGDGQDTASYDGARVGVTASLGNASINTGDAKGDVYVSVERLFGSAYTDKLNGSNGDDILGGAYGNDVLNGGAGKDILIGGRGGDSMAGGAGSDTFAFHAASDSTVASAGRDTISDFSVTDGDRIDVSMIDANLKVSGNQAFTYLGTAAFTGKAGELNYSKQATGTYVYGDTNGDKQADFAIHLDDAVSLSKGYFIL